MYTLNINNNYYQLISVNDDCHQIFVTIIIHKS